MAKASVIKFEFEVAGKTRDDCIDTLDNITQRILTEEGGEPWVVLQDSYDKMMTDQHLALTGDPRGFFYTGKRQVVFTGPSMIADNVSSFRDGFRPQGQSEDEPF